MTKSIPRRFVGEYGTHYATTSILGTRMVVERRYSVRERNKAGKNELRKCANRVGAEVLGLQTEIDKNVCHDDSLKSNIINSTLVERMVVSTYGSFLADSLSSWSEQVLKLGRYLRSGSLTNIILTLECFG